MYECTGGVIYKIIFKGKMFVPLTIRYNDIYGKFVCAEVRGVVCAHIIFELRILGVVERKLHTTLC